MAEPAPDDRPPPRDARSEQHGRPRRSDAGPADPPPDPPPPGSSPGSPRPSSPTGGDGPSSGFGRFLRRTSRQSQTLAGAAGIVALGFIGSRVLGLLRSVAIADAFGTDPELSAYWVAFRLPDLVFQLLAGATLSAAFIPTFSRVLVREGDEGAWRLASNVLNLVSLATLVLAALAFLFAPLLVPLLAPGLGEATGREAELQSLAVDLTRLMLLSPLFFGVSGMLTGILNARQHFIAPAIAPLIYNLSIIFGAVVLSGPLGVYGLAWGVVIGSLGHLLAQAPVLVTVGMRWTPSLDVYSEAVRDVMRLMGPRVIGLAATQINFLVLVFFASFVSDAAISAINYAFLIVMLPVGVTGMAISTAVFPTLAQQAAASDLSTLRASLSRALRVILFLSIPASAGLVLLAEPGVRLLLERGAFDAGATEAVAGALLVYGIGVFAYAGIEILSRGFYALSDTRTPVIVAVLAMLLNVVLAAILVAPFGLQGLAGAAAIAAVLEFLLLLRMIRERLDGFDRRGLRRSVSRTVVATVIMAEVVVILRLLLGAAGADVETTVGAGVILLVAGGVGALTFLGVAYLLDRESYDTVRQRFRA